MGVVLAELSSDYSLQSFYSVRKSQRHFHMLKITGSPARMIMLDKEMN